MEMTDWTILILIIKTFILIASVLWIGFYMGRRFEQTKQATTLQTRRFKERQQTEQPVIIRKGFRSKTEKENKTEKKTYTIN